MAKKNQYPFLLVMGDYSPTEYKTIDFAKADATRRIEEDGCGDSDKFYIINTDSHEIIAIGRPKDPIERVIWEDYFE